MIRTNFAFNGMYILYLVFGPSLHSWIMKRTPVRKMLEHCLFYPHSWMVLNIHLTPVWCKMSKITKTISGVGREPNWLFTPQPRNSCWTMPPPMTIQGLTRWMNWWICRAWNWWTDTWKSLNPMRLCRNWRRSWTAWDFWSWNMFQPRA